MLTSVAAHPVPPRGVRVGLLVPVGRLGQLRTEPADPRVQSGQERLPHRGARAQRIGRRPARVPAVGEGQGRGALAHGTVDALADLVDAVGDLA